MIEFSAHLSVRQSMARPSIRDYFMFKQLLVFFVYGTAFLFLGASTGCGGGANGNSPPAATLIEIRGETWVLRDSQPVEMRNTAESIRAVYGYDSNGHKIIFVQGLDWTFDGRRFNRTINSRIPNFSEYTYISSSGGGFNFSSTPRNPKLILEYQIYIDYLSPKPDKLVVATNPGKSYKNVLCLGDSISAGAHTIGNYYFGNDSDSYCGLLRDYLGSSARVANNSVSGGVLETVRVNLNEYTSDAAEVVVLEFGMNDHIAGSLAISEFKIKLEGIVKALKAASKDVILLGFFQQNTLWLLEDPEQTSRYNDVILEVALSNNVAFIDIKKVFNSVASEQSLIENLTSDFMHHPNNYGQRIYFSLLVPYFMPRDEMASNIENYVFLDQ